MMSTVNYVLMGLLFVSWVSLFSLKDITSDSRQRVAVLQGEIIAEQDAIRGLMNDWAVLNEPGYLQDLAHLHLGLNTLSSNQIVRMAALPMAPFAAPGRDSGTMRTAAQGMVQFPAMSFHSPRLDRIEAAEPYMHWPQPSLRPNPSGDAE